MVAFKESAPLLTKESATAPQKALEVLAMRMRLLTTDGPPLPQIGNPGGVYLPVFAALDHGDDAWRPACQGHKVLQRAI